jgi:uncharacterized repeat protein (TIGR03803 family)
MQEIRSVCRETNANGTNHAGNSRVLKWPKMHSTSIISLKSAKILTLAGCLLSLWLTEPRVRGDVVFTTLVSFTYTNGPDYGSGGLGRRGGAMVQANDGNFYGTTWGGGTIDPAFGGFGTIYKMTPNGAFTSLYSFGTLSNAQGAPLDGQWPGGTLAKAADGTLYGTTSAGGPFASQAGTVFQITTNGALNVIYAFAGNNATFDSKLGWTNYDGANPNAGLVLGSDGNFYGTTYDYGAYGNGTVFQLTPGGTLTTLHAFSPVVTPDYTNFDGANPLGELVEGPDGNFYGTTSSGGTNGDWGTVFKITPAGTFTTLHSFSGLLDGGNPYGGLALGTDGSFYGTTYTGGAVTHGDPYGTIFRITTNGTLTTLHSFNENNGDGDGARAGLLLASDGNFYGTTLDNTVFEMTPDGTFTTLHTFSGPDGLSPIAALVQGTDGSLYGTTSARGGSGYGTIFRIIMPPVFRTITRTTGGVALTWSAISNQTCQVQYTTNLASSNWISLGSPITASNSTVSVSDFTGTNSQRFYRVQLLLAP